MRKLITILFCLVIGFILIIIGLVTSGIIGINVDGNTSGDTNPNIGITLILIGFTIILAPFLKPKKSDKD